MPEVTPDPSHWAYKLGHKEAMEGKGDATRATMAFGLMCAADAETAFNTRQWLAGWDVGVVAYRKQRRANCN